MKTGDLVRVPYQGLGVVISVTPSTATVQTLSGKRVRIHPSNMELVNENR
jgi:uncharacterized protein YlxW (UPF0749 family)